MSLTKDDTRKIINAVGKSAARNAVLAGQLIAGFKEQMETAEKLKAEHENLAHTMFRAKHILAGTQRTKPEPKESKETPAQKKNKGVKRPREVIDGVCDGHFWQTPVIPCPVEEPVNVKPRRHGKLAMCCKECSKALLEFRKTLKKN